MTPSPRRAYSIRRRVALLVAFGALAPMALAFWALHFAFVEVSHHLLGEHQLLARSLALHFDREVREDQAGLLAAVGNPEDWSTGVARRGLRALLLRSPILDAVAYVARDPEAGTRVIWQELRHGPLDERRLLALPEITTALASGRQGVARLENPEQFVFLVPVRDWTGQVTGLVAAPANPANPTWLAVLGQGALGSGAASLLDEHGRTIVRAGGSTTTPPQPDDVTANARLAVVPWQVVLRQPREEALGPLLGMRLRLFILSPLWIVFVVFFSWGATHSVTQPLKALGQSARHIADGDLDSAVPPQPDDEVGRLGRSLETMRVALKKSLDELKQSHEVLEQRVAERTTELRMVLNKFVSAQEDERRRIARELHDETCQTVAALGMKLDAALAAPGVAGMRERLQEARAFASRTLAEVHALIYELRPSVLDDLGLFPAIRWLADHHLTPAGIGFRCEVSVPERPLSPERQITLFRAIQEAIRNVARHSGATMVLIQVEERAHALLVEIEDDGHGFDPVSVKVPGPSGRGLGLLGMRERVAVIGGSMEIISSSEAGTRVVLCVPFEEEDKRG
jgi:signal transduction histidine kinase